MLNFLSNHFYSFVRLLDLVLQFFVDPLHVFELLLDHQPVVCLQDLLVYEVPPCASVQLVIEVVLIARETSIEARHVHVWQHLLPLFDLLLDFCSQLAFLLLFEFSLHVVIERSFMQVDVLECDRLLTKTLQVFLVKVKRG